MYKITVNDGDIAYGVKEMVCDTEADLEILPDCAMGSTVIVIETGSVYIRNSRDEWVKL